MIDNYKIITITHKSADIKDIGKFIIPESNGIPLSSRLEGLKKELSISELLYLPTCNRVMFFFCHEGKINESFLHQFTQNLYPEWDISEALAKFLIYEGKDAIRHLFEVSASVDSLVVGEREIIRQLREAYHKCNQEGLTGDSIRLAMDATVRTAKQIYADTKIGEKQVSVVSLAIKKLLEAGVSNNQRVLIVGAGQTNLLVCKFLKKHGFSNISVFNRTLTKAEELSNLVGGSAFHLSELENYSKGFDCMVVCTGAVEPVINKKIYSQLLQGEKDKKVIVDLAIPNNVSKEVVSSSDIDYIEIEGLKVLAKENMAFRTKEVTIAKKIIATTLKDFKSLYAERQLEKAFHQMPKEIKAVKTKAINEVFKKEVEDLDEETKDLMERMLSYMEKKCIGIPMKVAKSTILP